MEPEGSLLYSLQEPATGPYSKPDEPRPHISNSPCISRVHFTTILPSAPMLITQKIPPVEKLQSSFHATLILYEKELTVS
jgi:hypothetical protein